MIFGSGRFANALCYQGSDRRFIPAFSNAHKNLGKVSGQIEGTAKQVKGRAMGDTGGVQAKVEGTQQAVKNRARQDLNKTENAADRVGNRVTETTDKVGDKVGEAMLFVMSTVPAQAANTAQSRPTDGTVQLDKIMEQTEDVAHSPPMSLKEAGKRSSKGLNEVQGAADKDPINATANLIDSELMADFARRQLARSPPRHSWLRLPPLHVTHLPDRPPHNRSGFRHSLQ
jgi:hypothetical protein